jgi:phosphoglycolate phosphatase
MSKKLILFDIDGILCTGRGGRYIVKSIKHHFGLELGEKVKGMNIEGWTLKEIFSEWLRMGGIENPEKHENFEKSMRDSQFLIKGLKSGEAEFRQIAGVEVLLKKLIKNGNVLGLLTGNSYESSKARLESVGLWKYFGFGGFGTEAKVRGELVDIAIDEARKHSGIGFDKGDVYLVGDTPRDVEAAHFGKVKIVAVATGRYSVNELEEAKPDYVFEDFSDVDKIVEAIE